MKLIPSRTILEHFIKQVGILIFIFTTLYVLWIISRCSFTSVTEIGVRGGNENDTSQSILFGITKSCLSSRTMSHQNDIVWIIAAVAVAVAGLFFCQTSNMRNPNGSTCPMRIGKIFTNGYNVSFAQLFVQLSITIGSENVGAAISGTYNDCRFHPSLSCAQPLLWILGIHEMPSKSFPLPMVPWWWWYSGCGSKMHILKKRSNLKSPADWCLPSHNFKAFARKTANIQKMKTSCALFLIPELYHIFIGNSQHTKRTKDDGCKSKNDHDDSLVCYKKWTITAHYCFLTWSAFTCTFNTKAKHIFWVVV
jgi:hypothetical protein